MKEITRKTNVEMVDEMKKLNILKDNEKVLDSYTGFDPTLNGQFITVITAEDHVYFKTTYFYSFVTEEYRFITVNGTM